MTDRGQRALAERLLAEVPALHRWLTYGHANTFNAEADATAAAILGEHGVYLPDGPLDAEQWARHVAELERLQRIEAAARAAVDCTLVDDTCVEHNALRAALEQD